MHRHNNHILNGYQNARGKLRVRQPRHRSDVSGQDFCSTNVDTRSFCGS